jgi:hypothetical protein
MLLVWMQYQKEGISLDVNGYLRIKETTFSKDKTCGFGLQSSARC